MDITWFTALDFRLKILQSVLSVKHISPVSLHYGEYPHKESCSYILPIAIPSFACMYKESRIENDEMAVLLGCLTDSEMLDTKDVAKKLLLHHYKLATHFSQSDKQPCMDD